MLRRFAIVAVTAIVVSCTARYEPQKPVDCNKVQCTCEQDPEQPQCVAIKTPDGGLIFDAGNVPDTGVVEDAGEDAPVDAESDADAQ